jgi:hypothetical protein
LENFQKWSQARGLKDTLQPIGLNPTRDFSIVLLSTVRIASIFLMREMKLKEVT